MSVYLIDYENVHYAGLKGIDALTPQDEVILFYGNSANTIPMELHIDIANSGAKVQYIKIDRVGKNYLDFQLSAMTGYMVGTTIQTNYIIISKDTGFDAVLDLWNGPNFAGKTLTFSRRESIVEKTELKEKKAKKKVTSVKEDKPVKRKKPKIQVIKTVKESTKPVKLAESHKKAIRNAVKGIELKPSDYTKIYKAYMEQKTKQDFNTELVKGFKQETGNEIYKKVVKLFEDAGHKD